VPAEPVVVPAEAAVVVAAAEAAVVDLAVVATTVPPAAPPKYCAQILSAVPVAATVAEAMAAIVLSS
jgi:hypothetical protein